ncbi:response regulator [Confluentibacter lentus]|uniref:response regulator n=1 Tax=Confluentibacter lentus TaxID=1699412 RepID=UPI000C290446|nr:response regulator [Confluentibacter lentus]
MMFLSQFSKFSKRIIGLSFLALVAISVIFYLLYSYIEGNKDLHVIATLLLIIVTILLIAVVYLLWNKAHDGYVKSELINNINELEKSLEKANLLVDHKSVYLANMSHEIRIPLNAVLGMLNMLKKTNLDSDQMAEVEIAQYSSEHLLQLVNMILDNAKFDDEATDLNLVVIDLESDLSKLFKVLEYQAWDKNLDFEFKFLSEKKPKFLLLGDLSRIQQVLINLINNAIKFTHSGKISITIHQTVSNDDNQIVTFYVKDTGVGLSAFEVNRIFKTSKNDDISTMQHYRGGGMGLSISYKLVKLMGGELEVESKENEGSIFYFSLQLKKTLNLKVEAKEPASDLLNKFDYKFSVLVAEDNKINQKVIKFLLEQQGADCTLVRNGLEAVKLYNILDFDLIFMDIYMPEMDGYEATKTIKASDKYAKTNTPIIAVSASAFEADIKKAKLSGVDDFLAKPIETERLKELLVKYSPQNQSN